MNKAIFIALLVGGYNSYRFRNQCERLIELGCLAILYWFSNQ